MPLEPKGFVNAGAFDSVRVELAAETLSRFGKLSFRAAGTSMLPAIRPGDVMHVRRRPACEATRGDIAVFMREGRLYAHRVHEVRGDGTLVTRGDTVGRDDEPVAPGELLGTVERISRGAASRCPPSQPALGAALFRRSALARRLYGRWLAVTRGAR